MDRDQPAFSRPRRTTGFGKNLKRVSTDVPTEIRTDLDAKVRAEGFETVADWLRDVCIAKVKGISTLRSVSDRRLASVAEIVPEKDR
jgi:hypothetical protein